MRGPVAWLIAVLVALLVAVGVFGVDWAALGLTHTAAPQRMVSVAAAADLKFALDKLVAEFRQRLPDVQVEITYGSSGTLFAQLSNRAPFDIFFSADMEYPRKLTEQGLGSHQTEFVYGRGRIVVWTRRDSSIDPEKLGFHVLLAPSVRKVAIANPQHAPYGRAAEAALKSSGVYDGVRDKLVYGENIAQTTQFVQTGAAEVGIIAYSLAVSPGLRQEGRFWEIPAEAYPPLKQGGVILNWAKDWAAAQELRGFVLSADGQTILRQYGLVPTEE